ncbi:ABC transporter permease [Jeotgalibacillus proteolyticus]|uniref:ABC transporter permease n=1 Tax=Jeotgalibacillus proteolyticus TaxID=2082395 RepID=A0A2S5GDL3_9BACL|nr:ABC transporter permease [Jeotgalibacillus proteolyticus]PPA71100.1 ABC transporter permease [Jeotgalibacillus proteolyticus]
MRNSLKVARWEFKRNIKNKSFIISLFLTPVLFILFATLPSLLSGSGSEEEPVTVSVADSSGVWEEQVEPYIAQMELDWDVTVAATSPEEWQSSLEEDESAALIVLDEAAVRDGQVTYYTSEETPNSFNNDIQLLAQPLQQISLQNAGLTEEQMAVASSGIQFNAEELSTQGSAESGTGQESSTGLEGIIPGAFAGLILFSIVMTGMMIFQSASQEKKEKVSEIILSSLTPSDLMQGKIIGYFWLGMLQVGLWLVFALPFAIWRFNEFPIMEYLLVPELILLIVIALIGYLLFAALFVGLGATVEDISSTSNFQGMIMMLPFTPFILIGPILSDPSGLAAQVGTFIPFTAPAVLIMRLSMLEEWPWIEISIAIAVLLISVWLVMKLAGKIFEVGILLYGKNASFGEIVKWVRS